MIVALIDDRDANRGVGESMSDLQSPKAGTHNDDVMGVR